MDDLGVPIVTLVVSLDEAKEIYRAISLYNLGPYSRREAKDSYKDLHLDSFIHKLRKILPVEVVDSLNTNLVREVEKNTQKKLESLRLRPR